MQDSLLAMFKKVCAGCGQMDNKMNKEHLFPQWLIERTGTNKTGIRWVGGQSIPAKAATIPLCEKCNHEFGRALESPVSQIFNNLESHRGISDHEAELLIRWLWKFEGLCWTFLNPTGVYTKNFTLKQRILLPISDIRGDLVLAISLIKEIDPTYGDAPMGIDSFNVRNAIFVAGVFSRIAVMVLLKDFIEMVPDNFSLYNLATKRNELSYAKLFYPKIGFENDTEAVNITQVIGKRLSVLHDEVYVYLKKILS